METKETIPTPEEYLESKGMENSLLYSPIHVDGQRKVSDVMYEWGVLFARHHVKEQRREIYEDAMVVLAESLPEGHIHEEDYSRVKLNIKQSILNAYPEENIK